MFFGCNENINGCLDFNACNYNVNANHDDGSCQYPQESSDWNIQIIASMNPWTVLDSIFDENNICNVCNNQTIKNNLNWNKKKVELLEIISKYKNKNKCLE